VLDAGSPREMRLSIEQVPRPDGARLAKERLGLTLATLDSAASARLGLRGPALVVSETVRGGAASRAGLERGDLVTQVGRYGVRELETLGELLESVRPGDEVALTVVRARGDSLYRMVFAIRAR
jgi:S1-C subfamily serine protease